MVEIETTFVPGHPEFWDKGYQIAPRFFDSVGTLEPSLNDIFSIGPSEPLHKVCRHIAKMVCNSLGALIVLSANGYGNDAMKIARSMFEGAVTIGYLTKHPDELQDYMDFVWISNRKLLHFLEKHAPEQLESISNKAKQESAERYDTVVLRFTNSAGNVRQHWCKRPFSQMVAEVGLSAWYGSFYHLASAMHHLDMRGVAAQIEKNPDPDVLDANIAPSEDWVEQALLAGHTSVVFALEQYVELALPDKKQLVERALDEFRRAWRSASPLGSS
jgi:hypothetical protein